MDRVIVYTIRRLSSKTFAEPRFVLFDSYAPIVGQGFALTNKVRMLVFKRRAWLRSRGCRSSTALLLAINSAYAGLNLDLVQFTCLFVRQVQIASIMLFKDDFDCMI